MIFKTCKDCLEEKPLSEYHKQKGCKHGVCNICKPCKVGRSRLWRELNPERHKKQRRKHYSENKARLNSTSTEYYKNNREHLKVLNKEWKRLNRGRVVSSVRLRKKKVRDATPNWLTEDHNKGIQEFYWLAQDLRLVTGESYHVDHIVPLKGKNVCGLHVPWNLQVLPADINLSKGNKYDNLA